MTNYTFESKATRNGKALQVTTQIKSSTLLTALKAFVTEADRQKLSLKTLCVKDGTD